MRIKSKQIDFNRNHLLRWGQKKPKIFKIPINITISNCSLFEIEKKVKKEKKTISTTKEKKS
ncbi:hypothetical protein BpHYR1_050190 [Brachionus plicatilis]|uniref:Uncharacterized protein n=1 Tax=Brachionus plicatilis TaxID=10195 RepID=A0A3M7R0Q3_BRAPC|nr:hypothetical protein BpHYR1_050190 [Brachionus plicatilis]